mmetsp:Transcript_31947/g.95660  ORF Transcript_31947/g.95660 Transcript_31947/m.95660 type:complete len:214 (-) Transcript_31947:584-1225(-)
MQRFYLCIRWFTNMHSRFRNMHCNLPHVYLALLIRFCVLASAASTYLPVRPLHLSCSPIFSRCFRNKLKRASICQLTFESSFFSLSTRTTNRGRTSQAQWSSGPGLTLLLGGSGCSSSGTRQSIAAQGSDIYVVASHCFCFIAAQVYTIFPNCFAASAEVACAGMVQNIRESPASLAWVSSRGKRNHLSDKQNRCDRLICDGSSLVVDTHILS